MSIKYESKNPWCESLKAPLVTEVSKEILTDGTWHMHIPFASFLIFLMRPKTLVELGTHRGSSFRGFCRAMKLCEIGGVCHAIDTWEGDPHAGFYGERVYQDFVRSVEKGGWSSLTQIHRMVFDHAVEKFEAGSIDLLHIDGLHTYEAVRHDYETWRDRLSNRGVVLFHDTEVKSRDFGVWRFWAEISQAHPSIDFKYGCGLGVLFVGLEGARHAGGFVNEFKQDPAFSRYFELLGLRLETDYYLWRYRDKIEQKNLEIEEVRRESESARQEIAKLKLELKKWKKLSHHFKVFLRWE